MLKIKQEQEQKQQSKQCQSSPLLQRKIEAITSDLQPYYAVKLSEEVSEQNAMTICNYIMAMKTEVNPARNYKGNTIKILCYLSNFHKQKPFTDMIRDDAVFYLDSRLKTEIADPNHKSIGTYNQQRIILLRFFKWLYYPNEPQDRRKTPAVMQNIPKLRRKEISTIKPGDLWNDEDDKLFLKYCSSKRDKAYHMLSRDSSCRPSEILGLKVKDLNFLRTVDGKQYAQITVNGKTGTRNIPLFASVPYIKDWLANGHPTANGGSNPNAYLIPSLDTKMHNTKGNRLDANSMNEVYRRYKLTVFPRKLNDPNVPHEDKVKLKALLQKPFNPYIRRHSALTQKAQKLTAPILRQHAGWRPGSNMEIKYTHFFGAESNDAILSEIYGLETAATLKAKNMSVAMIPKSCPQCQEPNTPDSKFCHHCNMILSYDAYTETIEEQQKKDLKVEQLEKKTAEMFAMLKLVLKKQISDDNSPEAIALRKKMEQRASYAKLFIEKGEKALIQQVQQDYQNNAERAAVIHDIIAGYQQNRE